MRACYWKGIRLWEWLEWWKPSTQRTGAGVHQGARQSYDSKHPGAPNFSREVTVYCVDEQDKTATTYLSATAKNNLRLLQLEDALIAAAKTAGDLVWCEDSDRKAAVTSGPHTGDNAVVSHGTAGGSWTPTAGRLVLARNPTNGEGFVAVIEVVGSGTVTIDVPSGFSVTSSWDLVDVAMVVPDLQFDRMDHGSPELEVGDTRRPEVTYVFTSTAAATVEYASGDTIERDTTT